MRTSIPPLPALLAFEAVARRQSFSRAAAELALTPSAVSHQVAHLERLLGVQMFERTMKGVKLTQAGEAYLRRVAGALGSIGSATDDIRMGVRNTLYVHASPSLASLWLMPRISDFAAKHPAVSLFLSSSPTHADFALGQVDVDIRYGIPNWPNLTVQPLFEERILPLASPTFIERHRVRDPEELTHVPLIQSTVSVVQWSDWLDQRGLSQRPDRFAFRFDRASLALEAAVQGLGVALESTTLARLHLDAGRLQPLFDASWSVAARAHFLVYPPRNGNRREVAEFVHWLRSQATDDSSREPLDLMDAV